MGPGEVWIDDVQVFGLAFSPPEMVELSKLITLADVKLQNGQIGDCLRLLEGYWPRFLEENVALPAGTVPSETAATKPPTTKKSPPTQRLAEPHERHAPRFDAVLSAFNTSCSGPVSTPRLETAGLLREVYCGRFGRGL